MSPVQEVRGTYGQLVKIVPSVRIDILAILADEIEAWNEREAKRIAAATVHGSRMAGQVLTMVDGGDQLGTWFLVGKAPDGKNCEDCLALHGTQMTYDAMLELKYTTRCNLNCRCDFETDGSTAEPLTMDEVEAALGA